MWELFQSWRLLVLPNMYFLGIIFYLRLTKCLSLAIFFSPSNEENLGNIFSSSVKIFFSLPNSCLCCHKSIWGPIQNIAIDKKQKTAWPVIIQTPIHSRLVKLEIDNFRKLFDYQIFNHLAKSISSIITIIIVFIFVIVTIIISRSKAIPRYCFSFPKGQMYKVTSFVVWIFLLFFMKINWYIKKYCQRHYGPRRLLL